MKPTTFHGPFYVRFCEGSVSVGMKCESLEAMDGLGGLVPLSTALH